jgi:hypothetical protein
MICENEEQLGHYTETVKQYEKKDPKLGSDDKIMILN